MNMLLYSRPPAVGIGHLEHARLVRRRDSEVHEQGMLSKEEEKHMSVL